MNDKITELLETILKAIVSKPEGVKVTRTTDEMGVLLLVKLGDGDAGMVIGRQGKTIQAIRIMMAAVGAKNRAKLNIKLDVPDRAEMPTRPASRIGKDSGLDNLDI